MLNDLFNKTSSPDLDLRDLSWLMSRLDVETTLERLQVQTVNQRGKHNEVWGFCPDHALFTGREPSHPKWSLNTETGQCYCFTESRGSNLLRVACRLLNLSPHECIRWLLQDDVDSVLVSAARLQQALRSFTPDDEVETFDPTEFQRQLSAAELERDSIRLLAEKNIRPAIAREFGCVEFRHGYYRDRFIFPVYGARGDTLMGFVATSVLKRDAWLARNPLTYDKELKVSRPTTADDYRKVLYPRNFSVGSHVIGANKVTPGQPALLVEGVRDMLKLRQEGFVNAFALGGSHLTDEQLKVLGGLGLPKVVFMFDGDNAGYEGAEKAAQHCARFFSQVYVCHLPLGVDPKDLSHAEVMDLLRNKCTRALVPSFSLF